MDWSTLAALGTPVGWALLGAAALANLVTVPLKAAAWRCALVASTSGGSPVSLRLAMSPVMIGALLNLLLPGRLGEPARVLLLHSRLHRDGRQVEMSVVVGSAVTESLISTAAWVALVAFAGAFLGLAPGIWLALAILAALWTLVLVASARNWWSAPTTSVSQRMLRRMLYAARGIWRAVAKGHRALRRPTVLVTLASTSMAGWLAQCLGTYALLVAFGTDGGWRAAALVLITVSVAQTLPILPGNVGVFQAAAALPLVTSYGVSPATALAFGVVLQLVQTVPIALVGALALVREGEGVRHLYASARRLRTRTA